MLEKKGDTAEKYFIEQLALQLNKKGTLHVFRKGFSLLGMGDVAMTESALEDDRNSAVIARYHANILRVVLQLKYTSSKFQVY